MALVSEAGIKWNATDLGNATHRRDTGMGLVDEHDFSRLMAPVHRLTAYLNMRCIASTQALQLLEDAPLKTLAEMSIPDEDVGYHYDLILGNSSYLAVANAFGEGGTNLVLGTDGIIRIADEPGRERGCNG